MSIIPKGFAASVGEGLSDLGRRRQPGKAHRSASAPCYRPAQLAGGVAELERRCLLSHITVGHHAHTASVHPGRIVADQVPAASVPQSPGGGNQPERCKRRDEHDANQRSCDGRTGDDH